MGKKFIENLNANFEAKRGQLEDAEKSIQGLHAELSDKTVRLAAAEERTGQLSQVANQELMDKIADLEKQSAVSKQRIKDLESELATATAEGKEASNGVEELEAANRAFAVNLAKLRGTLQRVNAEKDALAAQNQGLTSKLAKLPGAEKDRKNSATDQGVQTDSPTVTPSKSEKPPSHSPPSDDWVGQSDLLSPSSFSFETQADRNGPRPLESPRRVLSDGPHMRSSMDMENQAKLDQLHRQLEDMSLLSIRVLPALRLQQAIGEIQF